MKNTFVVSAPSGAGKTTLNRRLLTENDQIEMSVSFTARTPRVGEVNGVDYNFIDDSQFEKLIKDESMLEYANVFGTFYGTAITEIERIHGLGKSVLLEIDVQGWEQARKKLDATSIFILPPNAEALRQRLESRGTEPPEVRYRRLKTAQSEIEMGHLYDFFIINDDIERAYQELYDIVIKGKKGKIGNSEGRQICARLAEELKNAPWLLKLSAETSDKPVE